MLRTLLARSMYPVVLFSLPFVPAACDALGVKVVSPNEGKPYQPSPETCAVLPKVEGSSLVGAPPERRVAVLRLR